MNAMDILKRCREAANDKRKIEWKIEQRKEILGNIAAPVADPNGGSRGTGDPDKTGRILADIDALERELEARKEEEQAERVAACALADMVPELEGKVLYDYYVRHWDTPTIAKKEKYQSGYVRKMKRSGEQLMGMISPERVAATLPPWYLRRKGGEKN